MVRSMALIVLRPKMTVPSEEIIHKDVLGTEEGPLHHPDRRRLEPTTIFLPIELIS